MVTPVVVSRIQNRRGTQSQFDSLYLTYPGSGPNILQPGEIALCTDSHRIFIGNINGTYDELGTATAQDIVLAPTVITISPTPVYTVIPAMSIQPTAFFTYLYSVTNSSLPAAGSIGTNFSRNGELRITAIVNFTPTPPSIQGPVSLVDQSTDINTTSNDVSFQAVYNSTRTGIDIRYKHNFSGNLYLSIATIQWTVL